MKQIGTLKFGKHGIRDATGKYIPVRYSYGTLTTRPGEWLTIYARQHSRSLPAELHPVNGSDPQTDYFERDTARFPAGSPHFEACRDFDPYKETPGNSL